MRWKHVTNKIFVVILSLVYTIILLLNIIAPLHANAQGNINPLGMHTVYSIGAWALSLLITWCVYFFLNKKPEILFFVLVIFAVAAIILQNFFLG